MTIEEPALTRDNAASTAATLRTVPGVQRVAVCHRDGVAFYDDLVLREREMAAAAVASLTGVADSVAHTFALGSPQGAVVYGDSSVVAVRPVARHYVMVVVASADADLALVYRAMRRAGLDIDTSLLA